MSISWSLPQEFKILDSGGKTFFDPFNITICDIVLAYPPMSKESNLIFVLIRVYLVMFILNGSASTQSSFTAGQYRTS